MTSFPPPTRVMFTLTFGIRKVRDPETGLYECVCRELGTASCGISIEQALYNIREACDLELSTFQISTEMIEYLGDHGIEVLKDGDALRERDRIRNNTQIALDYDMLSTPEHFTRELILA